VLGRGNVFSRFCIFDKRNFSGIYLDLILINANIGGFKPEIQQ